MIPILEYIKKTHKTSYVTEVPVPTTDPLDVLYALNDNENITRMDTTSLTLLMNYVHGGHAAYINYRENIIIGFPDDHGTIVLFDFMLFKGNKIFSISINRYSKTDTLLSRFKCKMDDNQDVVNRMFDLLNDYIKEKC